MINLIHNYSRQNSVALENRVDTSSI